MVMDLPVRWRSTGVGGASIATIAPQAPEPAQSDARCEDRSSSDPLPQGDDLSTPGAAVVMESMAAGAWFEAIDAPDT